jgi:hypothetical protein
MKKIIAIFCFIVSMQTAFTQNIDSLLSKISAVKDDNLRVKMLFNFFSKTAETDAALALKNVQKLLAYSLEKKDKLSKAYAIAAIGYNYRGLGNTGKSLEYALKADAIARETLIKI